MRSANGQVFYVKNSGQFPNGTQKAVSKSRLVETPNLARNSSDQLSDDSDDDYNGLFNLSVTNYLSGKNS